MTGNYCQHAMLQPEAVKISTCAKCRDAFSRPLGVAILDFLEALFKPRGSSLQTDPVQVRVCTSRSA